MCAEVTKAGLPEVVRGSSMYVTVLCANSARVKSKGQKRLWKSGLSKTVLNSDKFSVRRTEVCFDMSRIAQRIDNVAAPKLIHSRDRRRGNDRQSLASEV